METFTGGHQPFPKIGRVRDALGQLRRWSTKRHSDVVTYIGQPKLHGTNVAIRFEGDQTFYQSRNTELLAGQDPYGFRAFCLANPEAVAKLRRYYEQLVDPAARSVTTMVLYGEWCGGNIQKGVALNKLPRMFVMFKCRIITPDGSRWFPTPTNYLATQDDAVSLPIHTIEDYRVTRYETVNLADPVSVLEFQARVLELTDVVDKVCPVGLAHGVTGHGEGYVWTCKDDRSSQYWFKSKGDSHNRHLPRGPKQPQNVPTPEEVRAAAKLVGEVCSPARLNQGIEYLHEICLPISRKSTGAYMQWVAKDIKAEEGGKMLAAGMGWKLIAKLVNTQARLFLFDYIDNDRGTEV